MTASQAETAWPFSQRARPAQDVLMREVDNEAVLLDLASGRYFGLDAVGTRMWIALTAAPSVETACAALLAEYDVDAKTLRRDVAELVEKLAAHGLLVMTEA